MKNIFILGCMMVYAIAAVAQQDPKAKQILDEVSKKTRSFETISAEFVFTMENKEMDINEKNEGSIQLKGQKYKVELPDIGIKVFSDGETIWNYMEDGNQVTVSNIDDGGSELMDPSSVFTIYEKGFRAKYTGDKTVAGKKYHQIELFPDSEEYEVSKILLSVGSENKMIHSALLHGTDGNIYGIEVKKLDTGGELPDSYFSFNPKEYKDLEVIDFR
jgi:outer membrane lipoprotein-sorting protein